MFYNQIKKISIIFIIIILNNNPLINAITASDQINKTYIVEEFDEQIQIYMDKLHFPSLVICIVKDNTIKFMKPYGLVDLDLEKKATNDTIYLVGSISKTITSTALMQLYEKGLFDLDDDINEYLPFPLRNPNYPNINITFRMILSHQASLTDLGILPLNIPYILINSRKDNIKNYDIIKEILIPGEPYYNARYWLNSPPGKISQYSELDLVIAGCLVEILSGESLEDYCQNNIFKILNMQNTSFYLSKIDQSRVAGPHATNFHDASSFPIYDFFFLDGPAGVWTKAEDLAHFFIAHMNDGKYQNIRILNESTLKEMHTIQYPGYIDNIFQIFFKGQLTVQHGLGWMFVALNKYKIEGHTGGAPGYNCHMYVIEYEENETAGVILLTNGPFFSTAILNSRSTVKTYSELIDIIVEKIKIL